MYEKAGLKDGDVIESINGKPLGDAGSTVKMIQALKSEPAKDSSNN